MSSRSDNFNRADDPSSLGSPSDGGGAYTADPGGGALGIVSNQAYLSAAGGDSYAVLDAGAADVEVQITVATKNNQGLVVRYADSSNVVRAVFAAFFWRISKIEAGVETNLSGDGADNLSDGDVVKLVASGDTLELYQNGVLRRSATSSFGNTVTKHGFYISNNTTTRFDDLTVTVTGGGGGVVFPVRAPLITATGGARACPGLLVRGG